MRRKPNQKRRRTGDVSGAREKQFKNALIRALRRIVNDHLRKGTVLEEIETQLAKSRRHSRVLAHVVLKESSRLVLLQVLEPRASLSKRERQITSLVGQELGNKGIAKHLGISEGTVSSHLKNIFHKLNVHTRAGLVRASWVLYEGFDGAAAREG